MCSGSNAPAAQKLSVFIIYKYVLYTAEQAGESANFKTGLSAGVQSAVSVILEEEAVVGTLCTYHCYHLYVDQGKASLFQIHRPKVLGYCVHNRH